MATTIVMSLTNCLLYKYSFFDVYHKSVLSLSFTDFDECSGFGLCDFFATCTNTMGSFNCECNSGFQGNGLFCLGETKFLVWCIFNTINIIHLATNLEVAAKPVAICGKMFVTVYSAASCSLFTFNILFTSFNVQ